jgi:hypothetical protein
MSAAFSPRLILIAVDPFSRESPGSLLLGFGFHMRRRVAQQPREQAPWAFRAREEAIDMRLPYRRAAPSIFFLDFKRRSCDRKT